MIQLLPILLLLSLHMCRSYQAGCSSVFRAALADGTHLPPTWALLCFTILCLRLRRGVSVRRGSMCWCCQMSRPPAFTYNDEANFSLSSQEWKEPLCLCQFVFFLFISVRQVNQVEANRYATDKNTDYVIDEEWDDLEMLHARGLFRLTLLIGASLKELHLKITCLSRNVINWSGCDRI